MEPLDTAKRDRAGVALALQLARRILHVGLHQFLDGRVDGDHRPGPLGEVVHEDVVALLRVLPEVEDLRHGRDVLLGPLPAEVGVDREAAGGGTVVAAQVEHGLVVADAHGARRQLVLGEVEPGLARRLAGAEQDRRHVVAVENDRLALTVLLRQLDAGDGGERRHQVETAEDLVVLRCRLDLARPPGDRRHAVAAFADGALGAAERGVAGIGIDVLPGTVVGRVEDQRVLVEAERAELVHDAADPGVEFDDRVGVLGLGHRLVDVVRVRQVRLVHLHEVDVHEERLGSTLAF